LAAGLLFTASAQAAIVNGVFTIDSGTIIDLYSATFDGGLNPDCSGAADPDECAYFGGDTPAGRAITFGAQNAAQTNGTLNVDYDDATGEISVINSLVINLPDQVLTIAGATVVTVTQGNGVPVANDTIFANAGTTAPNGTADANEAVGLGPSVFEHDDAPNSDAPDFATFNDIVDSCVGGLCGLIGILSLDGVRYRLLGGISGAGGDSFQLQTQTANNSIYKVDFSTAVIPVPAAVWLFGSALGLLGWVRRRAA
jgi:hypothetical protein